MTAIPRHSSIPEDVLLGRSAFQDQVFAAVPKAVVCQTRDHICRSIQNSTKSFRLPPTGSLWTLYQRPNRYRREKIGTPGGCHCGIRRHEPALRQLIRTCKPIPLSNCISPTQAIKMLPSRQRQSIEFDRFADYPRDVNLGIFTSKGDSHEPRGSSLP